jgi:probable HAF family extracellular repeat protein
MRVLNFSFTSLVAAGLFAGLATAQQPAYYVIDLGPVGGTPGQPFFVTNSGLVSGAAAAADSSTHAVLWFPGLGLKVDIGGPRGLGGPDSLAYVANDRGKVVGMAETSVADKNGEDFCGFKSLGYHSSGVCLPMTSYSGTMTALPTLGGANGTASWINNRDEIAGWAESTMRDPGCPAPQIFQFKPVVWSKGAAQELPMYPGDLDGVAIAINDNSDVVGGSGDCAAFSPTLLANITPFHALLWHGGAATDLGNLGGTGHFGGNIALDLNNKGQVVGQSDLPGDVGSHGFIWSKETGMQDVGTLPGDLLSAALSINDSGVVTGVSLDADFNLRAFLWQNGQMRDLNQMVRKDSPLTLVLACSINASGAIVGLAARKSDGDMRAYLALPLSKLSPNERQALAEPEDAFATGLSELARNVIRERVRAGGMGRFVPRMPVKSREQ